MKIDLYAKKIDKGHVKIGTVDVPEGFGYEYRMPVRHPIEVRSKDQITTSNSLVNDYRTFRYKPSVFTHLLKTTRMYLEE